MENQNIKYKSTMESLKKSYNSYIINKEAVIEIGTIGITAGTVGLSAFWGPVVVVPLVICSVLIVGSAKETYKKELLQALSIGELGNVKKIEKYYKQLPKKLREEWADADAFVKLAHYLKIKFPADKIYSIGEDSNVVYQELDDLNIVENIEDGWVNLSGVNQDIVNLDSGQSEFPF